jgi:hypothetical protein
MGRLQVCLVTTSSWNMDLRATRVGTGCGHLRCGMPHVEAFQSTLTNPRLSKQKRKALQQSNFKTIMASNQKDKSCVYTCPIECVNYIYKSMWTLLQISGCGYFSHLLLTGIYIRSTQPFNLHRQTLAVEWPY